MNLVYDINSHLTVDEKEVISILMTVVEKYSPNTTPRFAGGWVRDRMLGIPSDDIDVMLDNISGEIFAGYISQHLGLKDPHTIRANPEKSKNIETAKMYVNLSSGKKQELDFARARKEVYNDSRVPDIQPASPEEDAQRRDLTINSLFFNIVTRQVEDFTGKGIKDLVSKTIRTPLNPLITFKEDPLRIFRCIRFSAKYDGNIDPETLNAMKDPSLVQDIKQKISRERIGAELQKMFI